MGPAFPQINSSWTVIRPCRRLPASGAGFALRCSASFSLSWASRLKEIGGEFQGVSVFVLRVHSFQHILALRIFGWPQPASFSPALCFVFEGAPTLDKPFPHAPSRTECELTISVRPLMSVLRRSPCPCSHDGAVGHGETWHRQVLRMLMRPRHGIDERQYSSFCKPPSHQTRPRRLPPWHSEPPARGNSLNPIHANYRM